MTSKITTEIFINIKNDRTSAKMNQEPSTVKNERNDP